MTNNTEQLEERNNAIQMARDWGYFQGSIKNRKDLWKGKNILDIGMGAGPHSISYTEGGCKSYVGVDPLVGSDHVRDFRNQKDPSIPPYHAFPYTTDRIMELFPDIHLYSDFLENVADEVKEHSVNFALLAAVTEHLQNLPAVFKSIWEALDDQGIIWFSHCNYYSWSGHHRAPRQVSQLQPGNTDHNKVIDWRHLEKDHPDYSNPNFNRVRLDDLRDLTNKYFDIVEWSVSAHGIERLTADIRQQNKKYSLEELLGQNIYVTGVRRAVPLDMDLSDRQFFHPAESYRANDDHSSEDLIDYHMRGFGFLQKGNFINSHSNNNNAGSRLFNTLSPGDTISIRKFTHALDFTVAEVIRPKTGLSKLRVTEDIPAELISSSYDQWQLSKAT